jgi:hypothetical protein
MMWFFFGFITISVAAVSSLFYRLSVSWHGDMLNTRGIPYEYDARIVKGSVRRIRVGVSCHQAFRFTLKPEGSFDQFSKAIGLTKECQTGDAKFDDAIYVLSDDLALHRKLQLNGKLRANILRLVAACEGGGRLREINAHNGRLWVVVKPSNSDQDEAARTGELIVPALNHLAGGFADGTAAAAVGRDPFPVRAACMLAISTGIAINAFVDGLHMSYGRFPFLIDQSAPYGAALTIGLGTVFLLVVAALAWMGRSSRAHLVLIELILIGTIGATVTAYSELRDFNIELDRAPPTVIAASVQQLYTTVSHHKGRTTKHCHLELLGWPTPTTLATREIDCDIYSRLKLGQQIGVEQHPGALGWPWVGIFRI